MRADSPECQDHGCCREDLDHLEISVNFGSAAKALFVSATDPVTVRSA